MNNQTPRRWFRPRNVLILLLTCLLALAAYVVLKGLLARPGHAVDFNQKIADLRRSLQPDPDAPNQWTLIEQICFIHRGIREEVGGASIPSGPDFSAIYTPPPTYAPDPSDPALTPEEVSERNLALAQQHDLDRRNSLEAIRLMKDRGELDLLARLPAVTHAARPSGRGLILLLVFPELQEIRSITNANMARMALAVETRDPDEFVGAFEQTLALDRLIGAQGSIIDRILAGASQATAARRLQRHLMAGDLDAPACRRLLDAIDRLGSLAPPGSGIEGERLAFLDIVQATHSDDGHGDGIFLAGTAQRVLTQLVSPPPPPGIVPLSLRNVTWFLLPSKANMTAKGNAFYDAAVAYANAAPADRGSLTNPTSMVQGLSRDYMLLDLLSPAFESAVQRADETRMELNAARLLLALRIHELEHGAPPATLDELVPTILPSLPQDPYSADLMFRYKLLPAPDSLGRTFLLYSVGADRADDNATPHPESRRAALRPGNIPGADYIINAPEDQEP